MIYDPPSKILHFTFRDAGDKVPVGGIVYY